MDVLMHTAGWVILIAILAITMVVFAFATAEEGNDD